MILSCRPDDDMDDYDPSDSDDDYNETEKELLKKVRNRKKEDSDSEVSCNFFIPIKLYNSYISIQEWSF